MPTAYKVVSSSLRSLIDNADHDYRPGCRVEATHKLGLYGYSTVEAALTRARRMHGADHVFVVELAYDPDDLQSEDRGMVTLARCTARRVVGEWEPIRLARWPRVPGATIDLAPVVNALEPLPFLALHHGVAHWRLTAQIAAQLIPDVPDADPDVVAVFALVHDAKRRATNDSDDGPLAAAFARDLHERGRLALDDAQLDTLCEALSNDYPPATTTDETVGLCWDACRLAVTRVHCLIPGRYLSTDAARAQVGYTGDRA